MRKIITEPIFVIVVSLLAIILSLIPLFYHLSIAPSGTVFPLFHNYPADFNYYLFLMRQGYEGEFLATSTVTPEKFPRQFVQTFFLLLGHLARILNLDLPFTYTMARVVLGAVLLLTIYKLTSLIFSFSKEKRMTAFLLAVFGGGFWLVQRQAGQLVFQNFLVWWTELDTLRRVTFLPHHLLATIFLILAIICLGEELGSLGDLGGLGRRTKGLLAGFFGLLAGFVNPASLIILDAVIFFSIPILIVLKWKEGKKVGGVMKSLMVFFLISSLSLIHLYRVANSVFPWTVLRDWEAKLVYPITFREYIGALGPILILALLGLKSFLREKTAIRILILSWFLTPFILIFLLAKFLPMANARFLQAYHFIPIAILASQGLTLLKRRWRFLLLVFLFLYFIPYYLTSFKIQFEEFSPRFYNHYIPKEVFAGFDYLNKYTKKEEVVVTGVFFGDLVAAHTHNRALFGHPVASFKGKEKEAESVKFFSEEYSKSEATAFLEKYNIRYVFFGPDTGPVPENFILKYPFLRKVFGEGQVTIFIYE